MNKQLQTKTICPAPPDMQKMAMVGADCSVKSVLRVV